MNELLASTPPPSPAPQCANCGTEETPLWRRDASGLSICNACGLYLRLHATPRPVTFKRDNIKRRRRIVAVNLLKTTESPENYLTATTILDKETEIIQSKHCIITAKSDSSQSSRNISGEIILKTPFAITDNIEKVSSSESNNLNFNAVKLDESSNAMINIEAGSVNDQEKTSPIINSALGSEIFQQGSIIKVRNSTVDGNSLGNDFGNRSKTSTPPKGYNMSQQSIPTKMPNNQNRFTTNMPNSRYGNITMSHIAPTRPPKRAIPYKFVDMGPRLTAGAFKLPPICLPLGISESSSLRKFSPCTANRNIPPIQLPSMAHFLASIKKPISQEQVFISPTPQRVAISSPAIVAIEQQANRKSNLDFLASICEGSESRIDY